MPKEEIEFVEECLNQDDRGAFLINKMKTDFQEASPEDLDKDLEEFLDYTPSYSDLIKAIPNLELILDKLDTIDDERKKSYLLARIPEEQLIKYINDGGKRSTELLSFWGQQYKNSRDSDSLQHQANILNAIDSDLNRTIFLLHGGNIMFLPCVQDLYYRNQIVKAKSEFNFSIEDLLAEIATYNEHLKRLSEIEDEREKAEYISTIDNNEMKEALFFYTIEERENRDIVINSFERKVDPEIEGLDELARAMITEFFEDRLGEDYTEEMRELVSIVFAKTSVCFGELGENTNGSANHIFKNITISNRHKDSINRNIGFLIHEYAHLFSYFAYSYTGDKPEHSIEEGMADTFADLVINHYIDKHKEVTLNGKRVRIDQPYSVYSGYDFENAWVRTMLSGIENGGNDVRAIGEYLLGDKNKFATMVFGEKEAEGKKKTKFGVALIETDRSELYHSPELDFSNIEEGSIYYRRNHILPLFQIQNEVGEKADVVGIMSQGKAFFANYIASIYFNGRNFYEIPEEELSKFIKLLELQVAPNNYGSAITDIDTYKNDLIDNLTEEEISQHSFEILTRITAIFGNDIEAGTRLEGVVRLAFAEEIKKIKEGQPIEITREKMEQIRERLMGAFTAKTESNMYINEYISDFEFEASEAEQIQTNKITTQQIGQATINVPTPIKNEARQVETGDDAQEQKREGEEVGDGN
ncbi:MAG: hypothetical protein IKP28_02720 [Clostridia bacterium]|nr:hypothetical protein [Clostridia bacterium]